MKDLASTLSNSIELLPLKPTSHNTSHRLALQCRTLPIVYHMLAFYSRIYTKRGVMQTTASQRNGLSKKLSLWKRASEILYKVFPVRYKVFSFQIERRLAAKDWRLDGIAADFSPGDVATQMERHRDGSRIWHELPLAFRGFRR